MAYQIEFAKRAARKFSSLAPDVREKLQPVINSLAANPRPHGTEKMRELDHCYRIRHGHYRIVYAVRDDRLVVLVLSVADRRDVYRSDEIAALKKIIQGWKRPG